MQVEDRQQNHYINVTKFIKDYISSHKKSFDKLFREIEGVIVGMIDTDTNCKYVVREFLDDLLVKVSKKINI